MRTVILILLSAMVAAVATAAAQTPTAPHAPAASITGVVRDTSGAPLADVNVTLLGEKPATRTDGAGAFALREVAPGAHTLLFRRIGYQTVEYRWSARPGAAINVSVTMMPVARALDRMVVEAPGMSRRRGTSSIGGTVSDSLGQPVGGADVRLLGAGLSTVTDSTGGFEFQLLTAGSYVIRVRHDGLSAANSFMQIVDDDNRSISLKMWDLPRGTRAHDSATASGYGIPDLGFDAFDRRNRMSAAGVVFGPADLIRANRMSLDILLEQYRNFPSRTVSRPGRVRDIADMDEGDCLLIDGRRPSYQPLHTFSSGDVQLVEVFRANSLIDTYLVSQMDRIKECQGSIDRHPNYFVLWTRSAR